MNDILNNEDLAFLKELAHELKTQPTDCNADPRFWTIMDYEKERDEYGDYIAVYDKDGCETVFEEHYNDVKDLKEILLDNYDCSLEDLEELSDLSEIMDFIEDELGDSLEVVQYSLVGRIKEDILFLTKREAIAHLESNRHHYSSKAHTYAMTAWRSPEFEKLIGILKKFDGEEGSDDEL